MVCNSVTYPRESLLMPSQSCLLCLKVSSKELKLYENLGQELGSSSHVASCVLGASLWKKVCCALTMCGFGAPVQQSDTESIRVQSATVFSLIKTMESGENTVASSDNNFFPT